MTGAGDPTSGTPQLIRAAAAAAVRLEAFRELGVSPGGANPEDLDPETLHLGILRGGAPVAVCTLLPAPSPRSRITPSWRLRGMATLPEAQGGGLGAILLAAAIERARSEGARLVWGNLRVAAVPFYERHGFAVSDDVFRTETGVLHRYGELTLA